MRPSFTLPPIQFVRFVLVGAGNTVVSYLLYAALIWVGLHYALANLLALLLGIIFSFYSQSRFVFGHGNLRSLFRFVVAWALIYFANVTLIGQFVKLGLDAYTAGALALPVTTVLSYFVQKLIVFRSTGTPGT